MYTLLRNKRSRNLNTLRNKLCFQALQLASFGMLYDLSAFYDSKFPKFPKIGLNGPISRKLLLTSGNQCFLICISGGLPFKLCIIYLDYVVIGPQMNCWRGAGGTKYLYNSLAMTNQEGQFEVSRRVLFFVRTVVARIP